MLRNRLTGLFATVVLGSLFCSCSTLPEHEGIDVALVNVRLDQATVWETVAIFTVRVSNGTPEPLIIDGSVHKFYLNGLYVGQGLNGEKLQVSRLSSTTQEIPVYLRNIALATRIRPILEARALDYRVNSTLYVVEGGHSRRCRLNHEGRLALEDFQPAGQGEANRQ
jgi:LEA14-like dessication related protein